MQRHAALLWLILSRIPALFGIQLATKTLATPTGKKSIFIRHLDGGSTNAVEMELAALTNPIYDLNQYGIRFVASPRHADVLLITGPLTRNMVHVAEATFDAMPSPKRIVTAGDCADWLHGGSSCLFAHSYATVPLPEEMRQAIVLHIPGDPPAPERILQALLTLPTA